MTKAKFWAGERFTRVGSRRAADPPAAFLRRNGRQCIDGEGRLRTSGDIHHLADEELMQLVQTGDARAFETVYDRHGGAAFSLAYRMVGNRTVAEDVTQEAFLSIWRSRLRYEPTRGSVRTWVLGIVHHRTIDALRRNLVHDRRRTSAEGIEDRLEAPERTDVEVARRQEADTVRAALHTLPEQQTKVIELAYFGGFTHTQIAEMLSLPIGTVKGRMRLGLDKLHRQLAGDMA
jgi:RNA polymerase sigma-70 factor (ECF subfamily)